MKIYLKVSELANKGLVEFGGDDDVIAISRVRAITTAQLDATMEAMGILRGAFATEQQPDDEEEGRGNA